MKGFGEVPWKKKKSYLFLRQCFQNLSALQAPPTPRTRASCSLRSWGGHVQDRCGRGAVGDLRPADQRPGHGSGGLCPLTLNASSDLRSA